MSFTGACGKANVGISNDKGGIGESLFEYVKSEAKQLGCYEVTLNVWAGNTPAEKFYEKMGMRTKERQMEYIL